MPYEAGAGFAWLEVLQDAPEAFEISRPEPLLVTDCPLIAAEVSKIDSGRQRMNRHFLVKLLQVPPACHLPSLPLAPGRFLPNCLPTCAHLPASGPSPAVLTSNISGLGLDLPSLTALETL